MAISKKTPLKEAVQKKAPATSGKKKAKTTPAAPGDVITGKASAKNLMLAEPKPENNFDYAFNLEKCSVLEFAVEGSIQPVPPVAGSFFVSIDDPNTPKKARVRVMIVEDLPGASARLTLKFNGKANDALISIRWRKGRI